MNKEACLLAQDAVGFSAYQDFRSRKYNRVGALTYALGEVLFPACALSDRKLSFNRKSSLTNAEELAATVRDISTNTGAYLTGCFMWTQTDNFGAALAAGLVAKFILNITTHVEFQNFIEN